VLFGRPDARSAAAWGAIGPIIIENPDDFDAVRAALARSMETG
jgi:hypothetical protein